MRHTLSVRLPDELANWLRERSRRTGLSVGQIVRDELERARVEPFGQRFVRRHAGVFKGGPDDLSTREGFGPL